MPADDGPADRPTDRPTDAGPDDPLRRLYEAAPDGFVAARTAAVDAARAAGDPAAAKRLAALRKPTVAAWLVNLLAWRRPDLLDELVDLAAALRAAQRDLRGEQLRELSTARRQVVSGLVAEARRLAVEADAGLGAAKLPLAEVETTLTAALADLAVAEQVRSGRLVRAATYAGFGEVPRPRLRLVTAEDAAEPPAPADQATAVARPTASAGADDARARQRRALARDLDAARTEATRADHRLDEAETAERDAAHTVTEIEVALAELDRRRAIARGEVVQCQLARRAALRATAVARRRVGELQAALEALDETPRG